MNLLFWGNWNSQSDSNLEYSIETTWYQIANSVNFWSRISEYGIGRGSYGQNVPYPSGGSGKLAESTIQSNLQSFLEGTNLVGTNAEGGNNIWVVFLPSNASSTYDTNNGSNGHHQWFADTNNNIHVHYAVIEYGDNSGVVSHEIDEAATRSGI